MVSRLPERLGARRYKICERILSLMTANQIKLAAAIGFAAFIPVAYQWKVSSSEDRSPNASMSAQQVDLLDGTPKASPVAPSSPTQSASPRKAVLEPRAPGDWQAQRFRFLVADLSDEEWKICRGAAVTLKGSDTPAELAVPALAKALADEEWQVRKETAPALATYGEEANAGVPALIEALRDEEWHVRNASAMALV